MTCLEEGCRRFDSVDAERLGILGGSYGYMTSGDRAHRPVQAACSERSCNNLLTLETGSDIAGTFRGVVGRTHFEDPDAYLRQSPITYVSRITTPVPILHSDEDLRCPVSQAEELFVALRLLGRRPSRAVPRREPRAVTVRVSRYRVTAGSSWTGSPRG